MINKDKTGIGAASKNDADGNTVKIFNTVQSEPPHSKEVMGSLGSYLTKAREAANMTQAEMAGKLRLSVKHVIALETENYDNLPASTFIRGYLRGYARVLGLSEETLVNAYERSAHQAGQATTQPALKQIGRITSVAPPKSYIAPVRHIRWIWIVAVVSVGVLLALIYPWVNNFFDSNSQTAPHISKKKVNDTAPSNGTLDLVLPPPVVNPNPAPTRRDGD